MNTANITIHPSWKEVLKNEFSSPYFLNLKKFLVDEKQKHIVYPVGSLIFSAFNHTPFEKVKVVIIGQDPYHGPGQANGLCFSVSLGVSNPPSLKNIFKELNSDLGIPISHTGNLESWARLPFAPILLAHIKKKAGKLLLMLLLKPFQIIKKVLSFYCGGIMLKQKKR